LDFRLPSRRVDVGPAPLAIVALLLAILLFQLALPRPGIAPKGRSILPAPTFDPAVAVVPDYPQILIRPLFSPTRSSTETGADEASASVQLSDFSLVGVAIGRGLATAVVRGPGGETRRLRPGDRLIGWTVAAIRPDAVELEADGRKRELPVTAQPAPAAVPFR
jgi:hypothetical protein